MYAGRFESAQSLIDAAEASRPYFLAHEPAIVAWIDYALSVRALFAGDLGDNVRLKESVIENFEKAGDHRNACMQRVRLGYGWIVVGSAREGERVLREALMEARRAGLAKASALAKHNLGLALLRLGQHKEAATLENEALVAFAAQGDRRLCAASHLYLAWIWEALGDGEQAEFHAKETIAHQEPNSPMYAEALATLAELRLRSDKAADAFEPALRAHELMLKLGAVEDSEALIRLVYARTLHGAGSVALGKRALAEAKARLLERAQRIRDPELRRGFLEDEPVNRSTMSLASDWLS
jgi:tetratricopeptide (TPR) repeat protein